MRVLRLLLALTCLALIAGCTAPQPSAPAPDPSATPAPVATPTPAPTPSAGQPTVLPTTPASNMERAPLASSDPAAGPSRSCKTNADCAIKDIGSCCGYYPMCVNKDASTNPAAVRAECEKRGMSSVCGFPDIKGCECVEGQCQNRTDGSPAVM